MHVLCYSSPWLGSNLEIQFHVSNNNTNVQGAANGRNTIELTKYPNIKIKRGDLY